MDDEDVAAMQATVNRSLHVGLDFETFCELDIREVGMHKYVEHHSFVPLLVAVAVPNRGTTGRPIGNCWDLTDPVEYDAFVQYCLEIRQIVGHNVDFEKKVLERMAIPTKDIIFIDSAVQSRGMGGSSSLENATSQFLPGRQKMAEGRRLIRKYCIPPADPKNIDKADPDWHLFKQYDVEDAMLGVELANLRTIIEVEEANVTRDMNFTGWRVDLDIVKEMLRRFDENCAEALDELRSIPGAEELNPASPIQLKKWCQARGINATSFNEASIISMIQRIGARLDNGTVPKNMVENYMQVLRVLQLKQIIGGSSLKKLQKILDMTSDDGRLRGQYMHLGAGQSFRTSGTGVQMQNLKRLHNPIVMEQLYDPEVKVSNDVLAENLRQVFTATHPQGQLIVGDFSSVESRGLAFLAGADWKLDAYEQGKDMYKVLADKKFQVGYDNIDKEQRTFGKVGELSCGYGAGGGAVRSFAAAMGIVLSPEEAQELVNDWRSVNPEVVAFWALLDDMLRNVWTINTPVHRRELANGLHIEMRLLDAPVSLQAIFAGAKSLHVALFDGNRKILERVFHGLHQYGRDYRYYKPCDTQKADWVNYSIDPNTSERRYYTLYGGKLAGILTQSLCREMFFDSLIEIADICERHNMLLVGQFHDEAVVDWDPTKADIDLEEAKYLIEVAMSSTDLSGFPLAAEIKSDYRYTK